MLFLIDSSAWIEFYRPGGNSKTKDVVKDCLSRDLAAVNQLIVVEILRGTYNYEDYQKISEDMKAVHNLTLNNDVFQNSAKIGFELRKQGLDIPTIDLIIAATALKYDCRLIHLDNHFNLIADKYPLQVINLNK